MNQYTEDVHMELGQFVEIKDINCIFHTFHCLNFIYYIVLCMDRSKEQSVLYKFSIK